MNATLPAIVLGGSGYVAGEALRLIAQHPRLELGSAVSIGRPGTAIAASFEHLRGVYPEDRFTSLDAAKNKLAEEPHWIVVSAAPHGSSAKLLDGLMTAAEAAGVRVTVADASADFRYRSAQQFADVYGQPHPAPERLELFRCAVPEHLPQIDTEHAAQPGCFATAMLLAVLPLVALELSEPEFYVSAVTGSTGAGRTPRDTTHHPLRQGNLFAYQALKHRHHPEVCALVREATARDIMLHFVPHSGPFARGIHATVFARRTGHLTTEQISDALSQFYAKSSFVRVTSTPPRLKDVVGSNDAILSVSTDGRALTVCCVLDNLVKGAAGGALQWINRLLGWPDTEGLVIAPPGWV
jgi:N-acetyl-gamma-glutamyl-phosphate reductase